MGYRMDRNMKIAVVLFAVGIALIALGTVLPQIEVAASSGGSNKPFGIYAVPLFVLGLAFLIISAEFFYQKNSQKESSTEVATE